MAVIMLGFHFEGIENSFFFKSVAADDRMDEVDNASDSCDGDEEGGENSSGVIEDGTEGGTDVFIDAF